MKIWRVRIKDKAKDGHSPEQYWGEAKDYVTAGLKAVELAVKDGFKEPWVDEVCCHGEKRF